MKLVKKEDKKWAALLKPEDATRCDNEEAMAEEGTGSGPEGRPEEVAKGHSLAQHYNKWDKLAVQVAEEEKNEKPEGDEALNKLFQDVSCCF